MLHSLLERKMNVSACTAMETGKMEKTRNEGLVQTLSMVMMVVIAVVAKRMYVSI